MITVATTTTTTNSTSPYDPHHPITKIETDGDYVTFGNERYLRSDLVEAFGGTLNPGLAPPPKMILLILLHWDYRHLL